jgi:hypothetical protein
MAKTKTTKKRLKTLEKEMAKIFEILIAIIEGGR